MNPDVYVALGAASVVALVFSVALLGQKRRPAPVAVTLATPPGLAVAAVGPDGPVDRWTAMETKLGAIEQRQIVGDKRIADTEHDVKNIRAALAALPSKDAVHRLEVDLTALNGKVAAMDGTTTATQRAVERVEGLLMQWNGRS